MMNYYQPQIPNYYQQPQYDRLAQLQQFQQAMQPQNYINGKVVDSIEVVKATDIPMDGQSYYFPKADGTEIYIKKWLPTGQTQVVVYKPFLDDLGANPNNLSNDEIKQPYGAIKPIVDDIMSHIDERFDKIEKSFTNTRSKTVKKECDSE